MRTRLKGEIVESYDTHRHQIKIRDSMFFKQVIEPFVSPFYDIGDYIWAKLAVLIFAASFEFTTGLFETPQAYWETLLYLVVIDLLAKNIYILRYQPKIWNAQIFLKRTIFKGSSYILVCTTFTLMSNQWELGSNYIQYFGYLALCVLEFFSIMKHFKLTAWLIVIWRQVKNKKFDFEELKKEADAYSKRVEHDINEKPKKP